MSLETFMKLPEEKKELILSAGIREFSRKSFQDASTDEITKQCQISKGILFHYFGSKKDFYLYCLEKSMERLTAETEAADGEDFYEILFAEMNRKIALCVRYPDEMHMVNMASRDMCAQTVKEKAEIMRKYGALIQEESGKTLQKALSVLKLKDGDAKQFTAEGLRIYINAIMNRYLLQYQDDPDAFFGKSEDIRREMKEYMDLMLYGITG